MSNPEQNKKAKNSSARENMRSFGLAILLALFFRSFLFQPFHIPSGSMLSTLFIGDYLFVSKFAYGFSKHSLPFSPPLFSGRIFASPVERGDVIVFRLPSKPNISYIKRVIGLPGDKIQVVDGVVYINNAPLPLVRTEDFTYKMEDGSIRRFPQFIETLPEGKSHRILDETSTGALDNTEVYNVPAGHYFCMGDNRDNSTDSRVLAQVGYINEELIEGRATRIGFSVSTPIWQIWKWPTNLRFDRLWKAIE
jgi:signal peptidase I